MQRRTRDSRPVRALVVAGAYLAGLWLAPPSLIVFTALLGLLLVALAWIDLDEFRLPDLLTLSVAILGALMVFLTWQDLFVWHILAGGLGFLWLLAVEIGYRRLRGRDGLGRGDVKLFGALGIWVGLMGLPFMLLIGSASGLIWAVLTGRTAQADGRIAFGPWICLGGWVVWCLQGRWM
ncbi:MAG: prepilin peptidase [Hyphomonas sp.]|nr:prepilin peptidase [Hyphomonas sp.]